MQFFQCEITALFFVLRVSSIALGLVQDRDGLLAQHAPSEVSNATLAMVGIPLPNFSPTTSLTAPLLNTSVPNIGPDNATLNDMHITCQGDGVVPLSCLDALNTFHFLHTRMLTVGQRVTGSLNFDLNLPARWISGTPFPALLLALRTKKPL